MTDPLIVASAQQVSCDLEGEVSILHPERGIYFGLADVGARIWSLVQQPIRRSELERTLLAEYEVEPGELSRDLGELLDRLEREALIEVGDPSAG